MAALLSNGYLTYSNNTNTNMRAVGVVSTFQMPDWEVKTAALLSDGAELRDLLRATKAKYKERMAAVGGQNKILRLVCDGKSVEPSTRSEWQLWGARTSF